MHVLSAIFSLYIKNILYVSFVSSTLLRTYKHGYNNLQADLYEGAG